MSVFDVDFSGSGLPNNLTPVRRRGAKMLAWLQALVSPVAYLYGLFSANRTNNLYWLNHSGQVTKLQGALNDVFDNGLRRITISDGPYDDPVYLYLDDEEKVVFIDLDSEIGTSVIPMPDPVPLWTDGETELLGVEFIVNVPNAVAGAAGYDLARLKAIVDKYRLVSKKNYSINVY